MDTTTTDSPNLGEEINDCFEEAIENLYAAFHILHRVDPKEWLLAAASLQSMLNEDITQALFNLMNNDETEEEINNG